MITITDEISLKTFDKENDSWFINEVNTNSKSNMIHHIEERLQLSRKTDDLELSNAYLALYNNQIIGYVYLSKKQRESFYFEYLLLKEYRNKGLGSQILNSVSDKVFELNTDIKECILSIDKSNIPSQKAAENMGFVLNEDTYLDDKLEFLIYNPYYINRRNK